MNGYMDGTQMKEIYMLSMLTMLTPSLHWNLTHAQSWNTSYFSHASNELDYENIGWRMLINDILELRRYHPIIN
jgi:hypothetical protein